MRRCLAASQVALATNRVGAALTTASPKGRRPPRPRLAAA